MIGGDRCTRACKFCAIDTAKPLPLDVTEPQRIAEAVKTMKLKHAVITAVARDDVADGGADHFFQTIRAIKELNPAVSIEVLTPDFNQDPAAICRVLEARPDVFNHNLETVERLTPSIRSRATYKGSLRVLQIAREQGDQELLTKSGLMLGLGETEEEVLRAMLDLRAVGCDLLTLGQYLQPGREQLPVVEYICPEQFNAYGLHARRVGFRHVFSAPRVRSSYHAGQS
jgi:lipoic acid synthetase